MSANHFAFKDGAKKVLVFLPGIFPFGLIMGVSAANAGLNLWEVFGMNFMILAGASQLVALDLMTQNAEILIIVLTGWIINLRMVLYSASLSKLFQETTTPQKLLASYLLTDQAYAITHLNEKNYSTTHLKLYFYFGAGITIASFWHLSVFIGMFFGNMAPTELSLEFAIPLTFMALTIPSIKDRSYLYVALFSATLSIAFYGLPFNLGLILATLLGVTLGHYLKTKKIKNKQGAI